MSKNYIYIGLYLCIAATTTAGSDGSEVVGISGTDVGKMVAVLYYDPQRDVICIPAPPPPPKPEPEDE